MKTELARVLVNGKIIVIYSDGSITVMGSPPPAEFVLADADGAKTAQSPRIFNGNTA